MDLRQFAGKFSDVRWLGDDRFQARCLLPGHPDADSDYSLIARVVDGYIKVACFSSLGHSGDILTSLKLTPGDMRVDLKVNPPPPEEPAARPRPQERPATGRKPPSDEFSRRAPPHNLEAEQSVLGAVLLDNEALASARKIVTQRDFYREIHRTLFGAMCELSDQGHAIDTVTLKTWLTAHGKLDQIGGPVYLAELGAIVPSARSIGTYSTMVRDVAIKRRVASDATDLIEMTYNGVATDSLIGEWQRRVTVLDRGLLTPAEIPWEGLEDAAQVNAEYLRRRPVIDKLCYSSAVSMITGGKHAGKSTLARWKAICVSKGFPYLGREVMQGPVLYVASEDEEMVARSELIQLGWCAGDPIKFFGKSKIRDDDFDFLRHLTQAIRRFRAVLVIIDMLFDFVHVEDEMSYAGTRRAVGKIQDVASASEAHICVVHHAPKNANIGDATIAALGSQGLAARVSPIVLVRRFGPGVHSVSSTGVRDPRGQAVAEERLVRNEDGSLQLGGAFKNYMLAEVYAERVFELLAAEPGSEMTASEVCENLDISYQVAKSCLWFLSKDNRIARSGEGKKGRPFRYAIPLTEIRPAYGNSEDQNTVLAKTSTKSDHHENLEAQGRFGYKENEWTPPPVTHDLDNDDDEFGISKSK